MGFHTFQWKLVPLRDDWLGIWRLEAQERAGLWGGRKLASGRGGEWLVPLLLGGG